MQRFLQGRRLEHSPSHERDGEDVLCELLRDGVLVLTVGGRHDVRGSVLVEDVVDNVEEAREVTVLVAVTNGDEDGRDASSNTDGVLDVEVRLDTGVRVLRVGAIVERLEGEGGVRRHVGAELAQEALFAGKPISIKPRELEKS